MREWTKARWAKTLLVLGLIMALAVPAYAASWSSWRDGSNADVSCQAGSMYVRLYSAKGTKYQANVNYGIYNVTITSQTFGSEAYRTLDVYVSNYVPGFPTETGWDPDGRSYGSSPVRPSSVKIICK